MSIPDELLDSWTRLVARWDGEELAQALADVARGTDPMGMKSRLAARIVSLYHGDDAAEKAAAHFDRVVRKKDAPEEIETRVLAPWGERLALTRIVKEVGLAPSTSEARRLVEAGAVSLDGERVTDPHHELAAETGREVLLRVGKRQYLRLRIGGEPSAGR
jgi:tyrosyl-tRNA synthetase